MRGIRTSYGHTLESANAAWLQILSADHDWGQTARRVMALLTDAEVIRRGHALGFVPNDISILDTSCEIHSINDASCSVI